MRRNERRTIMNEFQIKLRPEYSDILEREYPGISKKTYTKIKPSLISPTDNSLNSVFNTIINSVMDGIKNGVLEYKLVPISCEKCHQDYYEAQLSFQMHFVIWHPKVTMKMYYHEACGLCYCRIKVQ